MSTLLITGVAGFIGSSLALKLLEQGNSVVGIDNLNDYYDVTLKKNRLSRCNKYSSFTFHQMDISNREKIENIFTKNHFKKVIHLAAQAGVRYSVENPNIYIDSNIVGFANILEGCRHNKVEHLIYASSSSVYGANVKLPFAVQDPVDHPLSLYGATKRANELMAHSYSHLYHLPTTGLRFFTVYGPWGRPDMALFKFTQNIIEEKAIPVYNNGQMMRDFTYVDDIVEGIVRIINKIPRSTHSSDPITPAISYAPYRIYNIGNQQPVELRKYIEVLETCLQKKAILKMLPMQAGDVPNTYADMKDFEEVIGVLPRTSIETGIKNFVNWYLSYYSVLKDA